MIDNFSKTYEFDTIVRRIEIDVTLEYHTKDGYSWVKRSCKALIDTGAYISGIKQSVVEEMGLKPEEETSITTSTDSNVSSNIFFVNVFLSDTYCIEDLRVADLPNEKSPNDFIIGMDILSHSDFAISNANGKTVFTIRLPPRKHIRFKNG